MDKRTIEVKKELYVQLVKKAAEKYENIVIYGAGRKGIGIFDLLTNAGIIINAFVVTNKKENKEFECGIPVYGIDDNVFDPSNTLVVIGVRKRWNDVVVAEIMKNNFLNIIKAPEGIEYFTEKDLDRSQQSVIQITAQVGCKIDCKYCPQNTFVRQYVERGTNVEKSMSFKRFQEYLEKIDSSVILEFAGFSEPFFNPDCTDMLVYANKKGHPLELFTTLEGMTKKDFDRIKNIPFREVVIHIPDKENNSNITITEEYLEVLEMMLDAKKQDGSDFVNWASCHGEPADMVEEMIGNRIRILSQLHDRAGNVDGEEIEKLRDIKGSIRCSGTPNFDHNVLLPDGTILLCDSDWGMKHVLGNLKKQTYQEVLESETVKEIKKKMELQDSDLICRNCCYVVKTSI